MTARLRIVVADDERPARSFLLAMLRSFPDIAVVGEGASGREAVALIEKEKPDLALLDWQMPELDGIGVVRMLKKSDMPLVAFVTAYDEYAVRAFELNAVDYLLKPVDRTRLREALNRAQERMEHAEIVSEQAARVGAAIDAYEETARPSYLERIPVRHREEVVIVPVGQIASIVAEGELLNITTVRNERHTITYQGPRATTRSRAIHQARPRDTRQHRFDHEGDADARRHPCRLSHDGAEAAGQPTAVEDPPRTIPEAVAGRGEPSHWTISDMRFGQ